MRKNLKKIICLALSAALALSNGNVFAYASSVGTIVRENTVKTASTEEETDTDKFVFDDTGNIITGYSGTAGVLDLASLFEDTSILGIKEYAFSDCDFLTKVILPDSIQVIESYAFMGCSALTEVNIPASCTAIGEHAFRSCPITELTIPASVQVIGSYAFENCTKLSKLTFELEGAELDSIGDYAFESCTGLTSTEAEPIVLPASLQVINDLAFSNCEKMTYLEFQEQGPAMKSIGDSVFRNTGIKEIALPGSITSLGGGIFSQCKDLKSVTLPERCEELPGNMFSNCSSLTEVVLPDSYLNIGDRAFQGCSALNRVSMSGVQSIGEYAFYGCSALQEMSAPALQTMEGSVFQGCSKLSFIDIPKVQGISSYAFSGCVNLKDITIPASCGVISASAFNNCTGLGVVSFMNPEISINDGYTFPYPSLAKNMVFLSEPGGTVEAYAVEKGIRFARFANDIKVEQAPSDTKYTYKYNGDILTEGIQITADFISDEADGDVRGTVDVSDCIVSGLDTDKTGKQAITVRYGHQTDTFDVHVYYDLSKAKLSGNTKWVYNQTYTGKEIKPEFSLVDGDTGASVTADKYTIDWGENHTDVGEVTITLKGTESEEGSGNYIGTKMLTYNIVRKSVADQDVVAKVANMTYTGKAIKPEVEVSYGDVILEEGVDYEISDSSYSGNVNAGTASFYITGIGNYSGNKKVTFKILPKEISEVTIEELKGVVYTGEALQPTVSAYLDEYTPLEAGTDYTVKYKNNINAGIGSALITGTGNYTGEIEKKFIISQRSILDASVSEILDQIYSGMPIIPAVTVNVKETELVSDTDYTVEVMDNTVVGVATLLISGIGNYKDTILKEFEIVAKPIDELKISVVEEMKYTGSALTPAVEVKNGKFVLEEGTDYTISYEDNIAAGTATIILTGKGNYTGNTKVYFEITKKSIENIEISDIEDEEYTGSTIKPEVKIEDEDIVLVDGKDYTLSYIDNIEIGTATIVITGIGNYVGEIQKSFQIVAQQNSGNTTGNTTGNTALIAISDTDVFVADTGICTEKTPEIEIIVTVAGKLLVENIDYVIAYTDMEKPGAGKVTIIGIGSYQGRVEKSAIVVPRKVRSVKVKAKKGKKMVVNWKKIDGATEYEVSIARNKKFTAGKKMKNTKAGKLIIKKLSKRKYYVRVRACVVVNGEKYYGSYSGVKKISIKK